MSIRSITLFAALAISGCNTPDTTETTTTAVPAQPAVTASENIYRQAVDHAQRSAADVSRVGRSSTARICRPSCTRA
ncbi:MAG: hypothetical protein GXP15_14495 [Gammaproteobacteria bacterium]|nr:hypothetical protein [Gammaproteobacteria bacterium]